MIVDPVDASVHHALPLQPTRLIGRDSEIAGARALLTSRETRMLTLTGPGGVGKTRLALAIAADAQMEFADGVCFVDLSALSSAGLVVSTIAQALGIRTPGNLPVDDALTGYLRDRNLLLVLDNFEHLLEATASLASLLAACPALSMLITSRERLRLRWEHTLPVHPLAVPDAGDVYDAADLATVPSVALFVERARAIDPGLTLTHGSLESIGRVCVRLDGLPLAIELAASQSAFLSPADMLTRLDARLPALRAAARDVPERHATLQAAIAWSYGLLGETEQAVFRRLGIFAGGWTPEAAHAVEQSAGRSVDMLDVLGTLVDKNLVRVVRHPDGAYRFAMLETIRDFALQELAASGELDDAHVLHTAYFRSFVENAAEQGMGPVWYDLIERDIENVRAALSHASASSVGDFAALKMATGLFLFYWQRGHAAEGRRWLKSAFEANEPHLDATTRLRALEALGTLVGWQREFDAGVAMLDEALFLAAEIGDEAARVRVLGRIGWIAWINGCHERAADLEDAIAKLNPAVDGWIRAHALLAVGHLLLDAGHSEPAASALQESIQLFHASDGERHGVAHALTKLALLQQAAGNYDAARSLALDGIEFARTLNDLHVTAFAADDVVQLVGPDAASSDVAMLLAAADALRARLSWSRTPREHFARRVEVRAWLLESLGKNALARADADGRRLALDQVLDLAQRLVESFEPAVRSRKPAGSPATSLLSAREAEVLALLANGCSNREISETLVLSVRTVEKHVANIYAKIGARGRADAAAFAVRQGLTTPDQ